MFRFIREVREFMRDTEAWMKRATVGTAVYQDIVDRQNALIRDLTDKLLARDLPELKTFTLPNLESRTEEYKPQEDADLAGEVYMGGENEEV